MCQTEMIQLKTVERLFHLLLYNAELRMQNRTDIHVLCNYIQNLNSDLLEADLVYGMIEKSPPCPVQLTSTQVYKKQKIDITDTIEGKTFRVSCKMAKRASKFINAKDLSKTLGTIIRQKTGWDIDLKKPKTEIVVHINHEGTVIGVPLCQKPLANREYILHTGLRSTIAWVISSLADIQEGDVVLDPMCGNAILLIEAVKEMNKASFWGCDSCTKRVNLAQENVSFADETDYVQILHADTTDLPLRTSSVDKIICDLPFGNKFGSIETVSNLYPLVVASMNRVLKPGGTAVLLTSTGLKPLLLQCCTSTQDCDALHNDLDISNQLTEGQTSEVCGTSKQLHNDLDISNQSTEGQTSAVCGTSKLLHNDLDISNQSTDGQTSDVCGTSKQLHNDLDISNQSTEGQTSEVCGTSKQKLNESSGEHGCCPLDRLCNTEIGKLTKNNTSGLKQKHILTSGKRIQNSETEVCCKEDQGLQTFETSRPETEDTPSLTQQKEDSKDLNMVKPELMRVCSKVKWTVRDTHYLNLGEMNAVACVFNKR